ncbi:MAG TPA: flagellar protein FlgN [Chthonomonadaceae bacterium]|nr:flagellar protein FlgN [Chthonomonadaceae bacterium]
MSKSNATPATLRRLLQQELTLGKRLVALAEEESAAIVAGDVSRLNALAMEQRRRVEEQQALETVRIGVTRELAWKHGIERYPTLSILLPTLPAQEQQAMKRLRQELLETEEELKRLNSRNAQLLTQALDFVEFSIKALTSAALQPARYGSNLAHVIAPAFYIDSKA